MTANWPGPTQPSTITAHNVVESLELMESTLAHLRSTLTELEISPSYLMLTNAEPESETARRYGDIVAQGGDLWPLATAVGHQVEKARNYLDEHGSKNKHRNQVARILQEKFVVVLGGSSAPVTFTATEVFGRTRQLLHAVQEGVEQVDVLWDTVLPRVKAAQETMEQLQLDADRLGVVEPLIGRTRALALDLADRLTSDPLRVTVADGPALDVAVARTVAQMTNARSGHDNLADDLIEAGQLVASLRVLRSRAESARETALEKVVGPKGLIRVPSTQIIDGPEGLASRLEQIAEASSDQEWRQRRTVLDMWLRTANKLNVQLTKAEIANCEPLKKRDELRGRLRAYQAKAAGMGYAEDLELMARFEDARSVLYTSPTDLGRAEVAVQELATRLRT